MLNAKKRAALELAKQQGYIVEKDLDSYDDLHQAYTRWCEENNRPLVVVKPRRVSAYVKIDLIYLNGFDGFYEFTSEGQKEVSDLFEKHPNRVKSSSIVPQIGHILCDHYSVAIEEAHEVAEELLRIYNTPGNVQLNH